MPARAGIKMRYLLDKITGIFLFYFQGCLFRGALQIHDKFHLKGEPCMSKGMDAKKAEKKEPQKTKKEKKAAKVEKKAKKNA
jgi:hypothetical protein